MSIISDLSFKPDTELSTTELNKRAKVIADAIAELQAFAPDWEAEVNALREVGLQRIDESLLPAYEQIAEISQLGILFSAPSTTSVEIGNGAKTFQIPEARRKTFAPTPYLMAYADGDLSLSMTGELSSYNQEDGTLVLTATAHSGTGTYDSWMISAFATTEDLEALRAQVIDAALDATAAATTATSASSAAQTAKDAAQASLASMQAFWYGTRSTPPSGAAVGAQYLDTSVTPNVVRVLTSTGWAATVTVSLGGVRKMNYGPATGAEGAGPFAVSGGFTAGDVYVNGVKMVEGVDVTLTPGASGTFTLAAALAAGDYWEFRGYLSNDAGDFYTRSEVNSTFAPLASPAFTGNPTAPTQSASDDSTRVATTGFVQGLISALKGGVSAAFDTLAEIAAAITAIQSDLNGKAPLASPEFTGNPTVPTQTAGTNSTRAASTAFVQTAVSSAVSGKANTASPSFSGDASMVNAVVSGTAGVGKRSGTRAFTIAKSGSEFFALLEVENTDFGVGSARLVNFARDGVSTGRISGDDTSTTYVTSSDPRLKEEVSDLQGSGDFIDALRPRRYKWKANGRWASGFLSTELEEVSPSSVAGIAGEVDDDGNIVPQAIDAGTPEIIANIVAELQSLRKRVAELEAR